MTVLYGACLAPIYAQCACIHKVTQNRDQASVLAQWLALFLHLQALYRVSDGALACLWQFIKSVLSVVGRFSSVCADITIPATITLYGQEVHCVSVHQALRCLSQVP